MDGVFTLCRATEGCTRLDRHEDQCNRPVQIQVRSVADQIRYLARRLDGGTDPASIAHALRMVAERIT